MENNAVVNDQSVPARANGEHFLEPGIALGHKPWCYSVSFAKSFRCHAICIVYQTCGHFLIGFGFINRGTPQRFIL